MRRCIGRGAVTRARAFLPCGRYRGEVGGSCLYSDRLISHAYKPCPNLRYLAPKRNKPSFYTRHLHSELTMELMTVADACVRLTVSRKTVYRMIAAGDLPRLRKIGNFRQFYFDKVEFDKAIRKSTR